MVVDRRPTIVLFLAFAFSSVVLVRALADLHLPGNQQDYAPVQPIAFSHRLHAGELQIDCKYCHSGAERSRHAGIPAASTCMNCHKFVTAPLVDVQAEDKAATAEGRPPRRVVSAELRKLYAAVGQVPGDEGPPGPSSPLPWVRVHDLPDYVVFDHRAHVNVGVDCQHCHGPVETMERLRQVSDLSMGWCVNCHRDTRRDGLAGRPVQPSLDCTTCHH